MNNVTFFPQPIGFQQTQVKNNGAKSGEGQSPFQALLNLTMSTEQLGVGNHLTGDKEANSSEENLLESLFFVEDERILELFEELANELSFHAGYLELNDSIKDLLSELPEQLKAEVMALFESKMPIEHVIESLRHTKSQHELVATLLFFNQLQTSGQAQFTTSQQQVLTQYMQQLVAQTNKEIPAELKQVIQRLVQQTTEQTTTTKQLSNFVEQTVLSKQETSSQGLSIQTFAHDQTVMSRAQQMTIHVGEQLTKEAEQHQFQRQFQEMMNRGLFRNLQNGVNQLSIKLYPEHLGRLDIQITQLNGIITARIMASTQVAKELIEGQLQNLRQAFAHQQLQVERIEVTQQEQAPQYQSTRDEQNREQQNQAPGKEENAENQQDNDTFSELLEEFTFMEKV